MDSSRLLSFCSFGVFLPSCNQTRDELACPAWQECQHGFFLPHSYERVQDSSDYVLPQYCSDMTVLMAALGATEVDWIGTSLGGHVGMEMAAMPGNPIRRLILNDFGARISGVALQRIGRAGHWRGPSRGWGLR